MENLWGVVGLLLLITLDTLAVMIMTVWMIHRVSSWKKSLFPDKIEPSGD